MARNPWKDPDPEPGDFDAEIEAMDPRDIQVVEAGNGAKVTVVLSGEDSGNTSTHSRGGHSPGQP